MSDKTTDYLHVIITSGNDVCSEATLKDLLQLNQFMKKSAKYYELVTIQYMQKSNDTLKKELLALAAAAQRSGATQDTGRYIPAKYSNIIQKLENVIDWFDGKIQSSKEEGQNESSDEYLNETIINKFADVKRRCVVFSVCITENILGESSNDSLTFLLNGLVKCQEKLKPDDYVCFNIGSSSHLMAFDNQTYIKKWKSITDAFAKLNRRMSVD